MYKRDRKRPLVVTFCECFLGEIFNPNMARNMSIYLCAVVQAADTDN